MKIKIEDVAATARALFGQEGLDALAPGGKAADTDWRITATTPTGGEITFHRGATAEDVALYWKREGWQL